MRDPEFKDEIDKDLWNRIPLGTDVHGKHDAYSNHIRKELDKLYDQVGDVSTQKAQELLKKFAGQMKGEIIDKLRANPGMRLNQIYGGGQSRPSPKTSNSNPSFKG